MCHNENWQMVEENKGEEEIIESLRDKSLFPIENGFSSESHCKENGCVLISLTQSDWFDWKWACIHVLVIVWNFCSVSSIWLHLFHHLISNHSVGTWTANVDVFECLT